MTTSSGAFGTRLARSVTINGIGVWHSDFDHKNGPTSAFYENRNLPIITALVYPEYSAAALRRRVVDVAAALDLLVPL